MPTRPLRPCTSPGCPELVKSGRCARHLAAHYKSQDARRGSAAARGYGRRWQRIRADHLQLEPLCRFCRAEGRTTAATEVDHIDGDSSNNAHTNLRSACKPCHSRRTMRDQVPR
jgi:5-methylcytosine-specific restriction protein A